MANLLSLIGIDEILNIAVKTCKIHKMQHSILLCLMPQAR